MLRLGLIGLCLMAAAPARAELTLCNPATAARSVAIAYNAEGTWTSEGWWSIPAGECATLVSGPLKQRHFYYSLSAEPGFAGDGYAFCVTTAAFTLSGADGDCAQMGAEQRPFGHIDTGETATAFSFDLPLPVEKAEVAAPKVAAPAEAALPATPTLDPAAQQPFFVQGAAGEPFSVTGLLQGCSAGEEFEGCTFYAEGWRWMVAATAGSNPAALAAMATLPVNTPLYVTGDVISYGDITVEAVVSNIDLAPADAYAATRDAMQGSWVSEDDPQAGFDLIGSELTDSYGGEVMGQMLVTVTDTCPDGTAAGVVMVQRAFGAPPEDTICLAVVDVTPDRLELSLVGRGNTLLYRRP